MRVFVAGVTGAIGKQLVPQLVAAGPAWVPPAGASDCYGPGTRSSPDPLLVLHLVATTPAGSFISASLGIARPVDRPYLLLE